MSKFSLCSGVASLLMLLSAFAVGTARDVSSVKGASQARLEKQLRYSPGDLRIEPATKQTSVLSTATAPALRTAAPAKAKRKAAAGTPEFPHMQGFVAFGNSWQETMSSAYGIYEVDAAGFKLVKGNDDMDTSYGSVYGNGKYFVAVPELYSAWVIGMTYHLYDGRTWEEIGTNPMGNLDFKARCMACDPVSHRYYGLFEDAMYAKSYYLAQYDMDTDAIIKIADYGRGDDWSALAFSSEGQMYAISKAGMLLKVDKSTGERVSIGDTGLKSKYMTSGCIDPSTDIFWYPLSTDAESAMYAVDLTTGTATFVFDMPDGEQLLSLFIPDEPVAADAPAAVTDLTAVFEGFSLEGAVTFTAPATTGAGAALTGEVSYTLYANASVVAEGSAAAGAKVSVPVKLGNSGEYTFRLVVSNAAGKTDEVYTTTWVGYGKPDKPADVKLSQADGKFTLTWEAVTTAPGDTYINPADVKYTVTRLPDNKVVATDLVATEFTEAVPETKALVRYSYTVVATSGDSKSAPAVSNLVNVGNIVPPFAEDFNGVDPLGLWTVLNENGDNSAWQIKTWGEEIYLNYPYSFSKDADDWAVLWPVELKADSFYQISFDIKASDSYTELVDVFIGKEPTAEALAAGELLFELKIKSFDIANYSKLYRPAADGVYYIAFHAKSPKGQNNIYVDNFSIAAPLAAAAPAAPTGLTIVRNAGGKLEANVEFTVPSVDMEGNALETVAEAKVYREGKYVGSVKNLTPGAKASYTDNTAVNGINNYTVTCVNAAGEGKAASASAYIGVYAPVAVDEIFLSRGADTGELIVTWDAVRSDQNGTPLGADDVTYDLYRVAGGVQRMLAQNMKGCTYTDRICGADEPQFFVNYAVVARTAGGDSGGTLSELLAAGAPYTAPFNESFADRTLSYIWAMESNPDGFTTWDAYYPYEIDVEAQDADNGFAAAYAPYASDYNVALLMSGNIDLKGLAEPELTFWYLDYPTANTIEVTVRDKVGYNILATVGHSDEADFVWKKVSVPLTAYKDEVISLGFIGTCSSTMFIVIDNVRIDDTYAINLAAKGISAPVQVKMNEEFNVDVNVENTGLEGVTAYTVKLFSGDRELASKECEALAADANVVVSVPLSLPVTAAEAIVIKAEVVAAGDLFAADNFTGEATVKVRRSGYPVPENLSYTPGETSVTFNWDVPDLSKLIGEAVTEDVESYPSFSIGLSTSDLEGDSVGDWTMYDVDGLPTYDTGALTEFANQGKPMSFIVFEGAAVGGGEVFAPHTGEKAFICIAARPDNGKGNDDWLVSPRLLGCAQTISFFARSFEMYGLETFEIYASSKSNRLEDFELIAPQTEAPGKFSLFEFDLPEGTNYFAIRCTSYDHYLFVVDDISYIPDNAGMHNLSVSGYNIYRDGEKHAGPVTETTWTESNAAQAVGHAYQVSALYDGAESNASEAVTVELATSAGNVASDAVSVSAAAGCVLVKNAEGTVVEIFSADGVLLYSEAGTASSEIPVMPGIYIVRAGKTVCKVAVR